MKPKTFFTLLFIIISTFSMASPTEAGVDIINSKHKNLFIFKLRPPFKGAMVEVFYSNGDLVTHQQLAKRKMVIDFSEVKSGTYTIKVIKGASTTEFQYVKK